MATLTETIWVRDRAELDNTVANLATRGGVVQSHSGETADVFMKKKLNIWVLIGGLLLCLVPGLVYLVWYVTADQDQQIRVQIGSPANLGVPASSHWFETDGTPSPSAGDTGTTDTPSPDAGSPDPGGDGPTAPGT